MMGKPAIRIKRSITRTQSAGGLSPAVQRVAAEKANVHEMFFKISAQVNKVTRNRPIVVSEATSRSETNMHPTPHCVPADRQQAPNDLYMFL
jgi:hypothetical protein